MRTTITGLILHSVGSDNERRRGSCLGTFWPGLLKQQDWYHGNRPSVTASGNEGAHCPSTPKWAEGRASRIGSFGKFHRSWHWSRERRSKPTPHPGGHILLVQTLREQPGGPAAGRASLVRKQGHGVQPCAAMAQIYLGPCLFCSWNFVATSKWLLYYLQTTLKWNPYLETTIFRSIYLNMIVSKTYIQNNYTLMYTSALLDVGR